MEPYQLLVTGSRYVVRDMTSYAGKTVLRAKLNDWHIIVGDAIGIDTAVIKACIRLNVPCVVYGIHHSPRFTNPFPYVQIFGDFLARDRSMAINCQRVVGLWDGHSKGTIYTYRHAVKLGKPGWLADFSRAPYPLWSNN